MKVQHILTAIALSLTGVVFAQTPAATTLPKDPAATPRIDQRQANQEKRMEQGVASGQLTTRETKKLEARETRIANSEAAAKADGVVTGKERRHLKIQENKASRAIARQKHDRQRAQ